MTTTDNGAEHAHAGNDIAFEPSTVQAQLLWVDPNTLIIGANTRADVVLTKQFVADIKERGVREPIAVRHDDGGNLVVRKGKRRALAAVEAGLSTVPALLEQESITDETLREIDRILDQLGENEHRSAISEADEARATQQLLELGLTPVRIARRRHVSGSRVATAAAVATSQTAMDAVASGQLSLQQAAVVAEFADDNQAVNQLTGAAKNRPEQFDHIAQRLRDAREDAKQREQLTAQLSEQGVKLIDPPDTLFGGKVRRLSELRPTPQAKPGTELTAERHVKCPGHAAYLDDRGSWQSTGDRVVATYVCTDFQAHSHAELRAAPGVATTGRATGPMTEKQKAERRKVIANNKAWDSAETVRRSWLKEVLLARKSAPKDAPRWIAELVAGGSHHIRRAMDSGHTLALELLGLNNGSSRGNGRQALVDAVAKASPARATTITVAILAAAMEKGMDRQTWRHHTPEQAAYLRQLQLWGYELSDVEQIVITPPRKAGRSRISRSPVRDKASTAAEAKGQVRPRTKSDGNADSANGKAEEPSPGTKPETDGEHGVDNATNAEGKDEVAA